MTSTDRKLELNAKTSVAQTGSQPFVYAKGLIFFFAPIVCVALVWNLLHVTLLEPGILWYDFGFSKNC
jgi:hypothetical protein